jgi:hypothetical protein
MAGLRHPQPIQPTAMTDAQLAGRVEQLGAIDDILKQLGPRAFGMCCVLAGMTHVRLTTTEGRPKVDKTFGLACNPAAESVLAGVVQVCAPMKLRRRTPVAAVLTRSVRMTMSPRPAGQYRRMNPIE